MRILGVDPGLNITGYGCVDGSGDRPSLIEAGVIRPGAGGTDRAPLADRLAVLHADLTGLLGSLRPDRVVVESLFSHYKHPATAIQMGHARGVILLAIHVAGIELIEYKPNEIKKSLTGNGHASKSQMQAAVQAVFGLPAPPEPPDVADALAMALCATRRLGLAMIRS